MKIKKILNENNEIKYLAEDNSEVEIIDETQPVIDEKEALKKELEDLKAKYDLNEEQLKEIKQLKKEEAKIRANLEKEVLNEKIKAEFLANNGKINALEATKKLLGENIQAEQIPELIRDLKRNNSFLFESSPNHSSEGSVAIEKENLDNGSFYK